MSIVIDFLKQSPVLNTGYSDTDPAIAIDYSGNIIVAYVTTGKISGGSRNYYDYSKDIAVFKLNGITGIHMWNVQSIIFNTIADDIAPRITTDSLGYIPFPRKFCTK